MAQLSKKKRIGMLLCLGAVVVVAAGWAWARSSGETSTDNAYVRGDVTSLAPKVAGLRHGGRGRGQPNRPGG